MFAVMADLVIGCVSYRVLLGDLSAGANHVMICFSLVAATRRRVAWDLLDWSSSSLLFLRQSLFHHHHGCIARHKPVEFAPDVNQHFATHRSFLPLLRL
jgi:hypothetical protein